MKKLMLITVAAVTPALALDNLWLTGDAGYAMALTSSDYDTQADELGAAVDAVTNQRFAWQLGVGYDWLTADSLTVASSLSYFDLGAVNLDYSANVPQAEQQDFYDAMALVHPESGRGAALALQVATNAFVPKLSLGVSAGPTYWQQSYSLSNADEQVAKHEQEQFGWLFSPIVGYQISQQWSVTGAWQAYGLDDEIVQVASVGVQWRPFAGWAEQPVAEPMPEVEATVEPVAETLVEPIVEPPAEPIEAPEPVIEPDPVFEDQRIEFAEQSRQLPGQQQVQQLADFLVEQPTATVVLIGYAADWPDAETNQYMSEFRVAAVRDYLVQVGIDNARIQAIAMGDATGGQAELERVVEVFVE
ncbi:OmpA family protein [Salinibius halmophilus]|uniref:OmpA family protein n=1 Tax=Salinibius halmophilus TaxID=1853216 RepID=UPI000E670911|nr:OmpA family protein [Salinibius halmophilus]